MNRLALCLFLGFLMTPVLNPRTSAAPLDSAYQLTGGVFTETFDSMGTGTNAPGPGPGQHYWSVSASGTEYVTKLRTNGTSTGGYNTGLASNGAPLTDRALGVFQTGAGNERYLTARFQNSTGLELAKFELQWTLELWTSRQTNNVPLYGGFQMWYSTNGVNWTDMGDSFEKKITNAGVDAADLISGGLWNVNGNSPEFRVSDTNWVSYTPVLPIPDGGEFYLRWNGRLGLSTPTGYASTDNKSLGVYVDDLQLRVIPEPSSLLLGLLGAGLCCRLLRRGSGGQR